jgi:hypothetical protein
MASDEEAGPGGDGMRASDVERQAVVDRLEAAAAEGRLDAAELSVRSGAAYAARTLDELAALTTDLPRVPGTPAPAPPGVSLPATGAPAPASRPLVGVFGGAERRGRWRPARSEAAVAVFGGVVVDFRAAAPLPEVLDLRATAVFGGIDVVLPEGATVEMTGLSLFGGRSVQVSGEPAAGGPVFRVRAVAVFGGISVRSATPGDDRGQASATPSR